MTVTYTITLGWWVVPALVTLISVGCYIGAALSYEPTGGWFDIDLTSIAVFIGGLIVSLVAWLLWALLA